MNSSNTYVKLPGECPGVCNTLNLNPSISVLPSFKLSGVTLLVIIGNPYCLNLSAPFLTGSFLENQTLLHAYKPGHRIDQLYHRLLRYDQSVHVLIK